MTPDVAEVAFFFLCLVRGWTESVLEKNPAYANAFETLTPFKVI